MRRTASIDRFTATLGTVTRRGFYCASVMCLLTSLYDHVTVTIISAITIPIDTETTATFPGTTTIVATIVPSWRTTIITIADMGSTICTTVSKRTIAFTRILTCDLIMLWTSTTNTGSARCTLMPMAVARRAIASIGPDRKVRDIWRPVPRSSRRATVIQVASAGPSNCTNNSSARLEIFNDERHSAWSNDVGMRRARQ